MTPYEWLNKARTEARHKNQPNETSASAVQSITSNFKSCLKHHIQRHTRTYTHPPALRTKEF